jgi:hypothetical protein
MFKALIKGFFCLLLLGIAAPRLATAQELPSADWYLVVYRASENALYWINENGQQAALARPQLPQESSYLDMRISPTGRYGVISATLTNGRQGLGIYDFETARWLQLHQAQEGETIHFGKSIFTADSSAFAVGFSSGDFESAQWRIILFETQTGNAQLFIDHTHPDAPEAGLSIPAVQYLDESFVHFQLIPQAVGGASYWPAFKWQAFTYDASLPVISESPYTRAEMDILADTGEVVMTYMDDTLPSAPQDGMTPNFNAVGRGFLTPTEALSVIYSDATRYQLEAKWAHGGDWVLVFSTDAEDTTYWSIIDTTAQGSSAIALDPQFYKAYGVSDGYILQDTELNLLFFNELNPAAATRIFQSTDSDTVVYVTPQGATFELTSLGAADNAVVATTPTLVINDPSAGNPVVDDCSSALVQRVGLGIQARVLPSMGALNVRQQPNGSIVSTLGGSTTFDVIGGAVCSDGLYWWQIQRPGLQGWVAEGNLTAYYIEPYAGAPTGDEPLPPAPEDPTNTPAPLPPGPGGFTTDPTDTPQPFVIVEGVLCGDAPAPRLTVGANAVATSNTPIQIFSQAGSGPGPWHLPKGAVVVITGGPKCSNEVNYWSFTGFAFNTTNSQMESTSGWIPEGSGAVYWLAPQ